MAKIIIPTDFSETSMNAIYYALELFKYDQSDVTIIYAFSEEVYDYTKNMSRDYFEEYRDKVKVNVDRRLQLVIAEMLERFPNPKHKYNRVSGFGSIIDVINEFVEKENTDLVVMGTKGKTNDANIVFGSNTINVIKSVKCPVLAVPGTYHKRQPLNILFPTDYMIPLQSRELEQVSNITKEYNSKMHFLYVSTLRHLSRRQEGNRAFIESCFEDNQVDFSHLLETSVIENINTTIENKKIDLLVMVNQEHSYLENMLYTSKIDNLGLNVKIPFLVLQNLNYE